VEADLHDHGVDVGDAKLMRRRSYRWLKVRILGLLDLPPAITYLPDGRFLHIPQTRLGYALDPPTPEGGAPEQVT
jgi:hypothetical protein